MCIATETKKAIDRFPWLKRYLSGLPEDLWPQLLPDDPGDNPEFAQAVKGQRLLDEERSYVIALQQRYNMPLRPNMSVKDTMIGVRLRRWKQLVRQGRRGKDIGPMPTDPLE